MTGVPRLPAKLPDRPVRIFGERSATIERVLQIGPKRHERSLVTYLTEPELDALIAAPDRSSWTGRGDHAIIILLAQTGLQASELTGLRCGDIHLGAGKTGAIRRREDKPPDLVTVLVLPPAGDPGRNCPLACRVSRTERFGA